MYAVRVLEHRNEATTILGNGGLQSCAWNVSVLYDDGQWWPDIERSPRRSFLRAEQSQIQGILRREDSTAPCSAYVDQPVPPPCPARKVYGVRSIEMEYV